MSKKTGKPNNNDINDNHKNDNNTIMITSSDATHLDIQEASMEQKKREGYF